MLQQKWGEHKILGGSPAFNGTDALGASYFEESIVEIGLAFTSARLTAGRGENKAALLG